MNIAEVYPDYQINIFIIEMFKIIEQRRKCPLKKIYPVSARPDDYIYCELHHIIPRAWFRYHKLAIDNSRENTILLSIREHITVHILLAKYWLEKGDMNMYEKMLYSIKLTFAGNHKYSKLLDMQLTDDLFKDIEWSRKQRSILQSKRTGWHHTDEVKQKISKANTGKKRTLSQKLAISLRQRGIKRSPRPEYVKIKISESEKRTKHHDPRPLSPTEELRKTLKESGAKQIYINNGIHGKTIYVGENIPDGYVIGNLKGKKKWITNGIKQTKIDIDTPIPDGWRAGCLQMSESGKQKISKSNTGKKRSDETKQKISKAKLGKKMSDEAKRKLSLSIRGKPWSEKRRLAQQKKIKNLQKE